MPDTLTQRGFEHKGLGQALHAGRLKVPLNQREYSWEEEHITDLFQDLSQAIDNNKPIYFLGTIVLKGGEIPEIVDGQQRLATTTILIAAIRDYLFEKGENDLYKSLETDFLVKFDRNRREYIPRLSLNVDDNEFFRKKIVSAPDSDDRNVETHRESHDRLANAARLAIDKVASIVDGQRESHKVDLLMNWIKFIEEKATVIILTVPDEMNAYMMFETLNDRGLRTSQADLLKNYLFGQAERRLNEAQQKWSSMTAVLESLGITDIILTYLRHVTVGLYGPTREKEIFEKIQAQVSGSTKSIQFLDSLAKYADDYVAFLTPTHNKWNLYPSTIRSYIKVMNELKVAQIRPLMLSVSHHFAKTECTKAFRNFVFWTVRFLIAGGMRGGQLEDAYGRAAKRVVSGEISTASQLKSSLLGVLPSDEHFKASFSTARVSQNHLARYYLRALEGNLREESHPELTPIEDTNIVNLEHILPKTLGEGWDHIDPEMASAYSKRIGNMVLLNATVNSGVGNESFATKWEVFNESEIRLTKKVAGNYPKDTQWGPDEINERQQKLAEIAVRTWPLS